MQNPPNHPSQSGHSVNGTTLAPNSSGLGPKSPNHSNNDTSGDSQGTVNATHSLNSASTFSPQSQAFPGLGQLASNHHVDAATTTRSNFGPHQSNVDTAANSQGTVNATLNLNSSTFSSQSQTFPVLGQLASHHHVEAPRTTRSNFGPHQSIENTTTHNQGTVNATFSLNSTSTFSSHCQVFPMSGQLASHHVEATRTRSVNFNIPIGLHRHSSSDPSPIRPQNTVNLNLIVGHNSSININLLRSNPPSQVARNITFSASSSTPPSMNNAYNPASSYIQPPFFNLYPTRGPIPSRNSEMNGNPQFTRHHSPYASPTAATVRGETPRSNVSDNDQEVPTAIPCVRQSTVNLSRGSSHQRRPSHPCPRIPTQNHTISQSGMGSLFNHPSGSHLFNQPTRYCFPGEKHNSISAPSSSTLNSPNYQVLFPGGGNLSAYPESHPVTEEVTEQALEPNFNNIPLPQTELVQAPSQVPSQNDNTTATTEPLSQAGGRNISSMRHKSHPYSKNGPYTCRHCNAIFECGYRYAAHMKSHYKDETPAERKKRRESKIRNRDLHIAQSPDGITIMPGRAGSFQQEGEPITATDDVTIMSGPPPANITHGKANQSNQGEEIPIPTIKVEPEDV